MYDEDTIPSHEINDTPHDTTTALDLGSEMPEAAASLLYRLQSAFIELSTALNETLRDQRSNATASLQRAQAMLRGVGMASPRLPEYVTKGLAPWKVRRVLAYIEENLGEPLRNKDLAVVAELSEYHFNVAFRNSVGQTPHEYLIRRRIERAQGLMLSTAAPLSEIAAECGLADQAHFTRLFRRAVGETPAAWRKARSNPGDWGTTPTANPNAAAQFRPGSHALNQKETCSMGRS